MVELSELDVRLVEVRRDGRNAFEDDQPIHRWKGLTFFNTVVRGLFEDRILDFVVVHRHDAARNATMPFEREIHWFTGEKALHQVPFGGASYDTSDGSHNGNLSIHQQVSC